MKRGQRTDEDFAREIQAHIELETERLVAEGLDPAAARQEARRRFGNVTRAAEMFYERRRLLWLDHLRHDTRCALRSMAKTPIVCAVAIASLAGGIGATTATLTIRNAIFYNPPPIYQDPQQLSRVTVATPERRRSRVPGALYAMWAADPELAPRMAASTPGRVVELRAGDRTELQAWREVTPDFFALFGVRPAMGQAFAEASTPDAPPPVVLSYGAWQRVFEGRSDALGTIVWLDKRPHTVTGVMPQGFWFAATDAPVWTALRPAAISDQSGVDVVIRRTRDFSEAALTERLERDTPRYLASHGEGSRVMRVLVSHVGGTGLGDQMGIVIPYLVGVAVFLTLLIACANVAILMFARWTAREREMAIRSSLGASRGRAVTLLLTESVLLAIAGGAVGVCATYALRGVYIRNAPDTLAFDLSIDGVILGQSAIITILAGVVAGLAPALYETRRLQTNPLRLIASSDRVRQRWRHFLVVLEISVTVALMVVAAGQVDASRRMLSGGLAGFDLTPLFSIRVENPAGVDVAAVVDAVRRVPGVETAAAGTAVPMGMGAPSQLVTAASGARTSLMAERVHISDGYFRSLGVPLRVGRNFAAGEYAGGSRVAIVNEILARQLWPAGDGVSARIMVDDVPHEIVGIVATYSNNALSRGGPRFYLPLSADAANRNRIQVIARASNDPRPLLKPVREEIRRVSPTYTVSAASTLRQVLEIGSSEIMLLAVAMGPLLGIGIFLTATGIFGVLAFAFARRANELALRVALGATRLSLGRLVVLHTVRLIVLGSIAGVGATYALTKVVGAAGGDGSSFGTPGWQAFALPVLIILIVGTIATWIPTRRALRIDPVRLLRAE